MARALMALQHCGGGKACQQPIAPQVLLLGKSLPILTPTFTGTTDTATTPTTTTKGLHQDRSAGGRTANHTYADGVRQRSPPPRWNGRSHPFHTQRHFRGLSKSSKCSSTNGCVCVLRDTGGVRHCRPAPPCGWSFPDIVPARAQSDPLLHVHFEVLAETRGERANE